MRKVCAADGKTTTAQVGHVLGMQMLDQCGQNPIQVPPPKPWPMDGSVFLHMFVLNLSQNCRMVHGGPLDIVHMRMGHCYTNTSEQTCANTNGAIFSNNSLRHVTHIHMRALPLIATVRLFQMRGKTYHQ